MELIKSVEYRPSIVLSSRSQMSWSAQTIDKFLALWDVTTTYVDFDNTYDLGLPSQVYQYELVNDFLEIGVIACYEDQMMYQGDNWSDFVTEWEALKSNAQVSLSPELQELLQKRVLIKREDLDTYNSLLKQMEV